MNRFHVVMTFGYRQKMEVSLAALSHLDKGVEFVQAGTDDMTFYTEIDCLTGMDAAVKALTVARRLEDHLTGILLEFQMQHCPDFSAEEALVN